MRPRPANPRARREFAPAPIKLATRSLPSPYEVESCVHLRLNQQSFFLLCGEPVMDFVQRHFVYGDVLMTDTTAGMPTLQTRCQKKRDNFRGQSARSRAGRENLYAFGGISGFFEKLTFRGIRVALVAAVGIIANDSCGQLNRPGVDGNPVLLDEQKLSLVSDSDNNRRAGSAKAVHGFPATLFDESQKLAGVQRNLVSWVLHCVFRLPALCTTTTPAHFISSIAFLTSSGRRLTPRLASSIKYVLKPILAASSAVNFTQ